MPPRPPTPAEAAADAGLAPDSWAAHMRWFDANARWSRELPDEGAAVVRGELEGLRGLLARARRSLGGGDGDGDVGGGEGAAGEDLVGDEDDAADEEDAQDSNSAASSDWSAPAESTANEVDAVAGEPNLVEDEAHSRAGGQHTAENQHAATNQVSSPETTSGPSTPELTTDDSTDESEVIARDTTQDQNATAEEVNSPGTSAPLTTPELTTDDSTDDSTNESEVIIRDFSRPVQHSTGATDDIPDYWYRGDNGQDHRNDFKYWYPDEGPNGEPYMHIVGRDHASEEDREIRVLNWRTLRREYEEWESEERMRRMRRTLPQLFFEGLAFGLRLLFPPLWEPVGSRRMGPYSMEP